MVEPSYVIDGKKASKKEFESLNATEIKSITVEKDGVIKVVTKAKKKEIIRRPSDCKYEWSQRCCAGSFVSVSACSIPKMGCWRGG